MFKKEEYKPMICPVCGEFEFTDMDEKEGDYGYFSKLIDKISTKENVPTCHHCGWIYDIDQLTNPDLKDGENQLSLTEYKSWYQVKIKEDPDYDYMTSNHISTPHKCPVCGKYEFEDIGSFDICPYCGWEDDPVMEDAPNYDGGANELSLNEYKKNYLELIGKNPKYKWSDSNK